jgi:hypothetical protein
MKPGWRHILIELLHREHPVGRVHSGCAGIGGGVGRNGAERLGATGCEGAFAFASPAGDWDWVAEPRCEGTGA